MIIIQGQKFININNDRKFETKNVSSFDYSMFVRWLSYFLKSIKYNNLIYI